MMGVPFHADVLGNVAYRLSTTSVVRWKTPSVRLGRSGWLDGFLIAGFFVGYSEDGGMR